MKLLLYLVMSNTLKDRYPVKEEKKEDDTREPRRMIKRMISQIRVEDLEELDDLEQFERM